MRKKLLIVSVLLCAAIIGNAQNKTNFVGVKLGTSLDWASPGSVYAENKGFGMGYGVGAVVEHYFTPAIAFSTGLDFRRMQMHYQFTDFRVVDNFLEGSPVTVNRRVRGSYLELPLKAKLKREVVDSWLAFVEAGLGVAVNLRDYCRDEYDFYGVSYSDKLYSNYSYQYRLLQASLLFGVGVEYEINRDFSLFAVLSVNHSLSNTFIRQLEKKTGSSLKANFVGIDVGVLFGK